MDTFLAEIANKIRSAHPDDLDHVTVVFNNRRSGLFLRNQFLSDSAEPRFLPQIVGMDTLINEWSELEIITNELLTFELYDIYLQQNAEDIRYESFEEFMSLGDMMLADFNEIDLYCVDASRLFSNLHDLKSIGEWNIETGQLTPFQQRYLRFYKALYTFYTALHTKLQSQHRAYAGMAYRAVAENIQSIVPRLMSRYYYFVGFNALSTCEEIIIKECVSSGIGELCTDGDPYYFDDDQQEAGYFLRKHKEDFPGIGGYPSHFSTVPKHITLVSCPENILQCKYTGRIIRDIVHGTKDLDLSNTAIVLADESLLLPVLNSLPEEVRTVNVPMGLPVSDTAAHSLILKVISLHTRRHGNAFYHQDILDILSDQLLSKLLGTRNIHARVNQLLYDEHVIYSDVNTLSTLCHDKGIDLSPLSFLFVPLSNPADDLLALISQLIQHLHDAKVLDTIPKEREAMACIFDIVTYLQDIQSRYHFIQSLAVLQKIYIRLSRKRSVSFYGQPLKGLQLLGVLETRNLDFKNLIILSANEGTLPAARSFNSLIPYNLKVAFGLPTFHEEDAVYAYNFYRLLQRAENIHILYSTESDIMGKGEPSRFIQQIKRELAPLFPGTISLSEEVVAADNQPRPLSPDMAVDKSPETLSRIMQLAQRGLSPSLLNKYRNCPLGFYYEKILKVEEPEQVNADLEQNELGTCIHAVLENIYSRDADHFLKPETLQQALADIDALIDQSLASQFHHGRSLSGRNHFLKSVARTQISGFLKSEIAHLKTVGSIEILGLEQPLSHQLEVPVADATASVLISGIADRIDSTGGVVRVIDYKSGKVEEKDLRVAEAKPDWAKVSDKWFQLMAYEWLYHHTLRGNLPHVSGIFPLRYLRSQLLTASWCGSDLITPEHLATFQDMLTQIVAEMLNPQIPFLPIPEAKRCSHCPFVEICQR